VHSGERDDKVESVTESTEEEKKREERREEMIPYREVPSAASTPFLVRRGLATLCG
jgi:hypothetical protein